MIMPVQRDSKILMTCGQIVNLVVKHQNIKKKMSDYLFWDEMWNTSSSEQQKTKFDEDHALDMVLNDMVDSLPEEGIEIKNDNQ